jgi:hypothetical protein
MLHNMPTSFNHAQLEMEEGDVIMAMVEQVGGAL